MDGIGQDETRAESATRRALIEAALAGFGEKGFAATTTREIAARAGTNIAAISYHFGGKEGLRTACARHVVEVLGQVAGAEPEGSPPSDAEAAQRLLAGVLGRMARFLLTDPRARLVAGFVIREMAQPSAALDAIHDGLFGRMHARLCVLWAVATGLPSESEPVKLAVFSVLGQAFYFHFARPLVLRRVGWDEIGPEEAARIGEAISRTLAARIEADRALGGRTS